MQRGSAGTAIPATSRCFELAPANGAPIRSFPIALGAIPIGPKQQVGG
jgi:hypothetical protein